MKTFGANILSLNLAQGRRVTPSFAVGGARRTRCRRGGSNGSRSEQAGSWSSASMRHQRHKHQPAASRTYKP
jgi:hypothetical protein